MSGVEFEVTFAKVLLGHGYVIARVLDGDTNFRVVEGTTLGGAPLMVWLDMPRAADEHGNQRKDLFQFALRNPADITRFEVGARVFLLPPADG